jgi:hypothetical protein
MGIHKIKKLLGMTFKEGHWQNGEHAKEYG